MSVAAPSAHVAEPTPNSARVIQSRVLGEIDLASATLFTFPEGLHGFAQHSEYALVPAAREGFWWLQAVDEAALAFLLADPFAVAPGYEVDISAGDEQFLGLTAPGDALVLTVVTLPASKGDRATTNLRGPLVFNAATRRARQVVSAVDGHSLHAVIELTSSSSTESAQYDATGAP